MEEDIPEALLEEYKKAYNLFDKDGDGTISVRELELVSNKRTNDSGKLGEGAQCTYS